MIAITDFEWGSNLTLQNPHLGEEKICLGFQVVLTAEFENVHNQRLIQLDFDRSTECCVERNSFAFGLYCINA